MQIPFCDIKFQYEQCKDKIDAAVAQVMESGYYINGPQVRELEEKLADYVGVKECVGVANGTDAILVALMALDIKAGDIVVTTPFTFIATAEVISLIGAKPAFVDIDPNTYNICPDALQTYLDSSKDRSKIKAIIAVDLYGQCADYERISKIAKDNGLTLVEDGAQAFGAEYKGTKACSFGDIATTSFFPAKPFGCAGDGGAVFVNDEKLALKVRQIKDHGQSKRYCHTLIGINGRLDTVQAAVMLAKFDHFKDCEIALRQNVATKYSSSLLDLAHSQKVKLPYVENFNSSVWAQYSIQLLAAQREEAQEALKAKGIPTAVHYPIPLSLQECFAYLGYKEGDFPVAEAVANRIMSLPMHPYLSDEQINYICVTLKEVL